MKHYDVVHGSQRMRPQTVEVHSSIVYIRSSIHREMRTFPDMPDVEPVEEWVYTEDQMTPLEYDSMLALSYDIPDGEWDEGLQELAREARYRRWDGPEQSIRRKIELGIDVEANQVRLRKILDYKQAVNATQYQEGYPTKAVVFPPEPEI